MTVFEVDGVRHQPSYRFSTIDWYLTLCDEKFWYTQVYVRDATITCLACLGAA